MKIRNDYPRDNSAICALRKEADDRRDFERLIADLCAKKYLRKETVKYKRQHSSNPRLNSVGNDVQYFVTEDAINYFEDKEKYFQQLQTNVDIPTYNIGNIHVDGGNVAVGNMVNSSLQFNHTAATVYEMIERQGEGDKEELRKILDDFQKILNEMQQSKQISPNKSFWTKATGHMERHKWLYAELVKLAGQAVMASFST